MAKTKEYRVPAYIVRLVRDGSLQLDEQPILRAPEDAARLLFRLANGMDREAFWVLMLDVRLRMVGTHVVSTGSLTECLVHPREAFKAAILAGAHAIVLGHNHPSGDPEPSTQDIALTRRLSSAGELLGIAVLDHVIVGHARFVSLRERSLF